MYGNVAVVCYGQRLMTEVVAMDVLVVWRGCCFEMVSAAHFLAWTGCWWVVTLLVVLCADCCCADGHHDDDEAEDCLFHKS